MPLHRRHLRRKVPPEEQTRYLRAIQSKAEALTELVNAFHEYSKVEHPEFILHPERTDLCEFLREYLAVKYEEIDLAGFSLEISIPEQAIFCSLDLFSSAESWTTCSPTPCATTV